MDRAGSKLGSKYKGCLSGMLCGLEEGHPHLVDGWGVVPSRQVLSWWMWLYSIHGVCSCLDACKLLREEDLGCFTQDGQ